MEYCTCQFLEMQAWLEYLFQRWDPNGFRPVARRKTSYELKRFDKIHGLSTTHVRT